MCHDGEMQEGGEPPRPRNSNFVLVVIAALVVVALIVSFVAINLLGPTEYDAETPEGAVQRYAAALFDGDVEQAMTYLSPKVDADCRNRIRDFEPGRERMVLLGTKGVTNGTEVQVRVIRSSGRNDPFADGRYERTAEFVLNEYNGEWLIDLLEVPSRLPYDCRRP